MLNYSGYNERHHEWRTYNSAPLDNSNMERYLQPQPLVIRSSDPGSDPLRQPHSIPQMSPHEILHPMTQQSTSSNDRLRHSNQAPAKNNVHTNIKRPDRTEANLQNPYII